MTNPSFTVDWHDSFKTKFEKSGPMFASSHRYLPGDNVSFAGRLDILLKPESDFATAFGYETARILFSSLEIDSNPENLKNTIINRSNFPGLRGEIRIDKFGDAQRKQLIFTVENGRFKTPE